MGFFDKIGKSIVHAAKKVERTTQKAVNQVERTAKKAVHEVEDFAEDVADTAENAARFVGNEIEEKMEAAKRQGEKVLDKVNFKKHLIDDTKQWLDENQEYITELVQMIQGVKDNGELEGLFQALRSNSKNKGLDANTRREYNKMAESSGQFRATTQKVKKIDDYQVVSFQLGGEGGLLLGANFAKGIAVDVRPPGKAWDIISGGVNIGIAGASGGWLFGFWKDRLDDLSGASISVGGSIGYIAGVGISRYMDFDGEDLGFVIEVGAGLGLELGVTIEGTYAYNSMER